MTHHVVAQRTQSTASLQTASVYPHSFRLLHWLLMASLLVLILTGPSLHAIARPDWSLTHGVLPGWFWGGRVLMVHLIAAAVFAPSIVAAAWVYFRRRQRKRLPYKWNHLLLLGGGLLMLATGLLLQRLQWQPTLYTTARAVHGLGWLLMTGSLLWHVVMALLRWLRLLVPAFHPWADWQWKPIALFVPLAVVTTWLSFSGNLLPMGRTLVATRIAAGDNAIDDLAALPWQQAPQLVVYLANGVGLRGGCTRASVQALHDGREIYFRVEWDDPQENRQLWPWKKTAEGWETLVTNPRDESVWYEDKFGLCFPVQRWRQFELIGCAVVCHAGGGWAYGYKHSPVVIDDWFWKAVRTDPVGQVDDKYWHRLDRENKDGGRFSDPKHSGGYDRNESKDKSHPAFLPDDLKIIRQGGLPREHAVPYDEQLAATIPPETLIPGMVISPFVGDRGDIRCQSRWKNGKWVVYMRRLLDTGSQYDVQFQPGGSYPFGVAAFDHTSKRHAYNFNVYWLVLEQ